MSNKIKKTDNKIKKIDFVEPIKKKSDDDDIDIPYPKETNINFQDILYKKREFYSNVISSRPDLDTYDEIEKYRNSKCILSPGELLEHQSLLGNFINPDTPYKGLLIFHGTGTGKTCAGISVSLKFIPLVQRYGTKIYILVPGPLLKEGWKDELIKCSGDFFVSKTKNDIELTEEERQKQRKQYLQVILQYYNIMSYKTFYKKVLGEKIKETEITEDRKENEKFSS